ncbi:putative ATPase [Sulfitobacter noctilucae]|uniref:ABC transporter transmembrane domain-containing protein n=1 Tax=Sulfitobacter noctilucae TaxID=1342302 RepID=UPI00046AF95B|nr:ABC transporter ATP-binding protein [Sulfitobacter noctilucae]KIN61418.1 putative ATPase [Sulfitobacter noctilucae]
MSLLFRIFHPRDVPRTGDDTAASSVWGFVWRMTGWHQVVACLIAVGVAVLNLAPIELQRRIVNEVVETQNVALLLQFGMAYLTVVVLHQLSKFGLRMYQGWLIESTNNYTRRHLLRLYGANVGGEDDTESGAGKVVSIVGSEVEKLAGFVGEALSQACANVAILLGVITYMFVVEPAIALFALAFMVPQIVLTPFMQRRLNELVEKRVSYLRSLGDHISEMDTPMQEGGPPILAKILSNRMKFNLLKFTLKAALNLMNALGPLSVLIYGGYLVMQGETQVGVIVAFISGFERISGPVRELVGFYRVAEQARVQHDMIAKWMAKVVPS